MGSALRGRLAAGAACLLVVRCCPLACPSLVLARPPLVFARLPALGALLVRAGGWPQQVGGRQTVAGWSPPAAGERATVVGGRAPHHGRVGGSCRGCFIIVIMILSSSLFPVPYFLKNSFPFLRNFFLFPVFL